MNEDLTNNEQPEEIEYAIHISDIHIRLNSRHIEYIEVFEKLYERMKLHNSKKPEIKEVVDASSSGQYDVPFNDQHKENPLKIDGPKSIYKGRAVKDKNFPKWGGPDSVFVKIKEKCKKFPYCNQGNTGAIEFIHEIDGLKGAITETS